MTAAKPAPDPKPADVKEAYATIGELVLIAYALDERLNTVLRLALSLQQSALLEPVIATIESNRKIEMLKGYASHLTEPSWKKGLEKLCKQIETVNRARNIACHSALRFNEGTPVLINIAAAKVLKNLYKNQTPIADLRSAIRNGEEALHYSQTVIENLERVEAALTAKRLAKSS